MKSAPDIRRDTEQPSGSNVASLPVADQQPQRSAFVQFVIELRRRRVCRAATMYALAVWLIGQIVELVSGPLGLPDWTLSLVILLGLVGFPIAMILSWMLDVTPQGVVRDQGTGIENGRSHGEVAVDIGLLAVALAIGMHLAYATFVEGSTNITAVTRIAVLPFEVAAGEDADTFSQGLTAELQQELASQGQVTVVAPIDPLGFKNCLTLTGVVATDHGRIRVTATLINNDSSEIIWADIFAKTKNGEPTTPADVAEEIVSRISVAKLAGMSPPGG